MSPSAIHLRDVPPYEINDPSVAIQRKSSADQYDVEQQCQSVYSKHVSEHMAQDEQEGERAESEPKRREGRTAEISKAGPKNKRKDWKPNELVAIESTLSTKRRRNRMAATRCRLKAKASRERLESDERALTNSHAALAAEAAALHNEVLLLRSLLLDHHSCSCVDIHAYLSNVALALSQTRPAVYRPRAEPEAVADGPDNPGALNLPSGEGQSDVVSAGGNEVGSGGWEGTSWPDRQVEMTK